MKSERVTDPESGPTSHGNTRNGDKGTVLTNPSTQAPTVGTANTNGKQRSVYKLEVRACRCGFGDSLAYSFMNRTGSVASFYRCRDDCTSKVPPFALFAREKAKSRCDQGTFGPVWDMMRWEDFLIGTWNFASFE
jgi:hypothetical protein